MPSWKKHLAFIASRPYSAWYLVKYRGQYVGSIYLTALDEIGVWVLASWRKEDLKPAIIRELIKRHRRNRFLANINPKNRTSARMLRKMGFRIFQETYQLQTKEPKS
jgi:RimJ/RimL family protein N-acetyltransferase